jgi:hypothetical protein
MSMRNIEDVREWVESLEDSDSPSEDEMRQAFLTIYRRAYEPGEGHLFSLIVAGL